MWGVEVEEDVGGLYVRVHDVRGVQKGQAGYELCGYSGKRVENRRAGRRIRFERASTGELKHECGPILSEAIKGHDVAIRIVRPLKLSEDACLLFKDSDCVFSGRDFDGIDAWQAGRTRLLWCSWRCRDSHGRVRKRRGWGRFGDLVDVAPESGAYELGLVEIAVSYTHLTLPTKRIV